MPYAAKIFVIFIFLFFQFHNLSAQDKKPTDPPKKEKPKKPAKPSKAELRAADQTKKATTLDEEELDKLSREEKNTMTRCPLHNKHMNLSDNYRANASDFQQSQNYPFAYQLQYRRYCTSCTKLLTVEYNRYQRENRRNADKPTFERCEPHSEGLFVNGDYEPTGYMDKPNVGIPHAKQYKNKFYCKTCTKLYKQVEKDDKNQ